MIEFRQTLYQHGLTQRRDAQFDLLDALMLAGPIRSVAELSQVPVFRRRWSSVYAALEDGRLDTAWLQQRLIQQVGEAPTVVFALDGSPWPRPHAPSVPDCQYVYHPTGAVDGGVVGIGQTYSLLGWVAEPQTSWVLPVDSQRIASDTDALEVGVTQVKGLCRTWQAQAKTGALIVAADAKYSAPTFLRGVRDQACGVVVRLRQDRVLYRTPGPYRGKGRPRKHGPRFAFKDPNTWDTPQQQLELQDCHWGRVRLTYWADLHARAAAAVAFGVLRVEVHTERATPSPPLWLAWQGPATDLETIWRSYAARWGIEPAIRWRKQGLHWTRPRVQSLAVMDRWTWLVSLAQWQVYLARPLVRDTPLPWQAPQVSLSPGRVQRGLGALFTQLGSPAPRPQPRGKSPGWPTGQVRTRPKRHLVVKKTETVKKPPGIRRAAT